MRPQATPKEVDALTRRATSICGRMEAAFADHRAMYLKLESLTAGQAFGRRSRAASLRATDVFLRECGRLDAKWARIDKLRAGLQKDVKALGGRFDPDIRAGPLMDALRRLHREGARIAAIEAATNQWIADAKTSSPVGRMSAEVEPGMSLEKLRAINARRLKEAERKEGA